MTRYLPWLLTVLAVPAIVQQPMAPAATASGILLGRAVDGATGKPLADVTVTLSAAPASGSPAAPQSPTRVITDADGAFVFHNVPRGSFLITAAKPGYVNGAYGKRTPSTTNGQPLDLTDGERRGGLAIPLWKYAVIGGSVVDEAGEPLAGVQVRVLRRTIVAGRPQFTQFNSAPTDDRGMYRLASLVPGDFVAGIVSSPATVPASVEDEYILAAGAGGVGNVPGLYSFGATPTSAGGIVVGSLILSGSQTDLPRLDGAGRSTGAFIYPTSFYPAAPTVAQAAVLALGPGDERTNVDFQLRPVPAMRVSGTVTTTVGAPAGNVGLQLLPGNTADPSAYLFDAATSRTDASGAFTFLGVTTGNYTIRAIQAPARPVTPADAFTTVVQVGSGTIMSTGGPSIPAPIPDQPTLWATAPVSVGDRDVNNVTLVLHPGARLYGQIQFDGTAAKPPTDRIRMAAVTIDLSDGNGTSLFGSLFQLRQGQFDADGQVHTYQLPGGRYTVRASGTLPGWTFAGATLEGQDISDRPLEITGTDVSGIIIRFTDHPAELSGVVRDDTRAPDGAASVLLFPTDSAAWMDYGNPARRIRSVSTSSDGAFHFTAVPEGDYLAVAVHDELMNNWQDPAVLRKLAGVATRVTISPGDKKVQDLTRRRIN